MVNGLFSLLCWSLLVRSFGNRWIGITGTGPGGWKPECGKFLVPSPMAQQHCKKRHSEEQAFAGRQSHRVPCLFIGHLLFPNQSSPKLNRCVFIFYLNINSMYFSRPACICLPTKNKDLWHVRNRLKLPRPSAQQRPPKEVPTMLLNKLVWFVFPQLGDKIWGHSCHNSI